MAEAAARRASVLGIYAAFRRPREAAFLQAAHGAHKAQTAFAAPEPLPEHACHLLPDVSVADAATVFATGVGGLRVGDVMSAVPIFADIVNFLGTLCDGAALRAKCAGLATIFARLGADRTPFAPLDSLTGCFHEVPSREGIARCTVKALRSRVCDSATTRLALAGCIEPRMRTDTVRFAFARCLQKSEATTTKVECVTTKAPDVLTGLRDEVAVARATLTRMQADRVCVLERFRHNGTMQEAVAALQEGLTLKLTDDTCRELRILLWQQHGRACDDERLKRVVAGLQHTRLCGVSTRMEAHKLESRNIGAGPEYWALEEKKEQQRIRAAFAAFSDAVGVHL